MYWRHDRNFATLTFYPVLNSLSKTLIAYRVRLQRVTKYPYCYQLRKRGTFPDLSRFQSPRDLLLGQPHGNALAQYAFFLARVTGDSIWVLSQITQVRVLRLARWGQNPISGTSGVSTLVTSKRGLFLFLLHVLCRCALFVCLFIYLSMYLFYRNETGVKDHSICQSYWTERCLFV